MTLIPAMPPKLSGLPLVADYLTHEVPDDASAPVCLGLDLASSNDLHGDAVAYPLPGGGWGYAALWLGARQATGDRRAGAAGPLPIGPTMRVGQPLDVEGEPYGDAAIRLAPDPAGRHRPLRADAGDGQRRWSRPVLLATPAATSGLSAAVGRWRARERDLQAQREQARRLTQPWLEPVPEYLRTDHRCGSVLAGLTIIVPLAILAWLAFGIAVAWLGGRL